MGDEFSVPPPPEPNEVAGAAAGLPLGLLYPRPPIAKVYGATGLPDISTEDPFGVSDIENDDPSGVGDPPFPPY